MYFSINIKNTYSKWKFYYPLFKVAMIQGAKACRPPAPNLIICIMFKFRYSLLLIIDDYINHNRSGYFYDNT